MMLKPSIDTLLDKVPSKYSLVILQAKRAHELEAGATPTQEFKSVKSTLQALEEIESGNVVIHPDPSAKREAVRAKIEAERLVKRKRNVKSKNKLPKKKKKKEKKSKVSEILDFFIFSTMSMTEKEKQMEKVAHVIVDIPLMQTDKPFSYGIPKELVSLVQLGSRVHVPFGKGNRLLQGFIIGFTKKIQALLN